MRDLHKTHVGGDHSGGNDFLHLIIGDPRLFQNFFKAAPDRRFSPVIISIDRGDADTDLRLRGCRHLIFFIKQEYTSVGRTCIDRDRIIFHF